MKKNQIPKSDPLPAKRTFTNILPAIQAKALLAIIRSSCHGTTICNVLLGHADMHAHKMPTYIKYMNKYIFGAEEMAQWLRTLTTLPEDPGLSFSTLMMAHKHL